ncbi:uncharacterized protein M421DRAFT_344580 [Didymella exigua CBS 183.55]|uniref:Beta-lactamase-related domain-containing protein n=1 Tax=Didymella exigua CBS 183.55 TaxID=1150837 RepID=A0A6A5RVY2_9PLEO|nr:uncharacterized protein M421DRAFT_344580 [Didymella exigua CBS 183.55]KAF1931324.1 hypothetical protein M421DRAFT_344580 [Didymella exigua CBS 183.55]
MSPSELPRHQQCRPKPSCGFSSCVKLAITVTALQCVQRGLVSLDSSAGIERLLRKWASLEVLFFSHDGSPILTPFKERLAIRYLLTHTSGLPTTSSSHYCNGGNHRVGSDS